MPPDRIRYVFLHLDGVVLQSILVPIIKSVVTKLGGEYCADIESNVLSHSQRDAASFLIRKLRLSLSESEVIELYNETRKAYLLTNRVRPNAGLKSFLTMLKANGYRVVAYGGADRDYFLEHAGTFREFFDDEGYIQTRDIRPGVKEIIKNIYGLDFNEALFIDDTIAVALAAKQYEVPFIGMTTEHAFSYQRQEMERLNVKYVVHSLQDVDLSFLNRLQQEALCHSVWK